MNRTFLIVLIPLTIAFSSLRSSGQYSLTANFDLGYSQYQGKRYLMDPFYIPSKSNFNYGVNVNLVPKIRGIQFGLKYHVQRLLRNEQFDLFRNPDVGPIPGYVEGGTMRMKVNKHFLDLGVYYFYSFERFSTHHFFAVVGVNSTFLRIRTSNYFSRRSEWFPFSFHPEFRFGVQTRNGLILQMYTHLLQYDIHKYSIGFSIGKSFHNS